MTEFIVIILVAIVLFLAAGLIKQVLSEKPEWLENILNDTGYQDSVTVHVKIVERKKMRGYGGFTVPSVVEYPWILFETDSGEQLEFQVEERLYYRVSDGQTGMLCYSGERVDYFELDDTPENLAKMFL